MVLLNSRFKNIFTLFDNDITGISLAKEYKKEHNTIPLWFPLKSYKKDFSDNLKDIGAIEMNGLISYLRYKYKIL